MQLAQSGVVSMEKYIYCPSCRSLTIHNRCTGIYVKNDLVGWLCQDCNPELMEFCEGESDGESE